MDVSANVLRKETVATLKQVEEQIEAMEHRARALQNIRVEHMVDQNGNFVLVPLLLAKAQCLNTLVLLRETKES